MNEIELDELLDQWTAPAPSEALRERVRMRARPTRNWPWGKGLAAAAVIAMFFMVSKATPQAATPEARRPYTVLSEFVRYGSDGSPTIEMYGTSYNDQYGREIMVARQLPNRPIQDVVARILDKMSDATAPLRFGLLRLSPINAELMDKSAALGPIPSVYTECVENTCIHGAAHYFLPKAAANPARECVDGPVVDRETILDYPTVAMQLPLDGNRRRRTVWMAPALGCFALKVATEKQKADGTFRLLTTKQALVVRTNP
jgi:hypothetical protein